MRRIGDNADTINVSATTKHRWCANVAVLSFALAGCNSWHGTPLDGRPAADVGALRIADHRDQVIVITFGFTTCPDVCPLTLSTVKKRTRSSVPTPRVWQPPS